MPKFAVTVEGAKYAVEAPDENTAWAWANQTHAQSQALAAKPAPAAAPEPEKPSIGAEMFGGLVRGGPMGGIIAGAKHGLDTVSDAITKGAYHAGGAVTDALAPYVPPNVAAGAGFATNVGTQAVPSLLGGQAAKVVSPALESMGRTLMQSALKPGSKDLLNGKGLRAAQTMLDEGINVSTGGTRKLQGEISQQKALADALVNNSTANIDKRAVAGNLQDTMRTYERQVDPLADMGAVQDVGTRFMQHPLVNGNNIPVQLAQELKSGTYARLADKYGPLNPETASVAAEKALANGLRTEIERVLPDIAPINARMADLINAKKVAERRALLEGNKNPTGLATLASNPIAAFGQMADRSSIFKSALARALYSGSESIPSTTAQLAAMLEAIGNRRGTQER